MQKRISTETHGLALALLLLLGSTGLAQDWAKDMFDHTSHDFGTVARGAKVEHRFTIENLYLEDAHISSIRASCGCTKPQITKQRLKTWEKAQIVAPIDTRGFIGRKDATITVTFDLPFPAEVQLHVRCYIRSDVVVQPGVVQFGSVNQGTGLQQKVTVSYAGRNDWRIQRVESPNPYLAGRVVELSRGGGQVTYELWVTLKPDTPAGYLQDFLTLVTNDLNPRATRVPVAVEGIVTSAITVRPSPLFLGVVEPGRSVTRPLVVQGRSPFRILSVQCDDNRFRFSVPKDEKPVQLVPVSFTATTASGKVSKKVRIQTNLASSPLLEAVVDVQVSPQGAAEF